MRSFLLRTSGVLGLVLTLAAGAANATPTLVGSFTGNECNGSGGFSNCYAYQNGTTSQGQTGGGSPAIFKLNSDATTAISSQFPTIDGDEFDISYDSGTNKLTFTYTPGNGDPAIHYYAISQANTVKLFYDANPITSGMITLSTYFPDNIGYSHITFFDTGSTHTPEPASVTLLGGALGGMIFARRRRNSAARSRN